MLGDSLFEEEEIREKKRLVLVAMLLLVGLLLAGLSWSLQAEKSRSAIAGGATPTLTAATPLAVITEMPSELATPTRPGRKTDVEATATATLVVTADADRRQASPSATAEAGDRPTDTPDRADEFKPGSPSATNGSGQITAEPLPTPTTSTRLETRVAGGQSPGPTRIVTPTEESREETATPKDPTGDEDRATLPAQTPTGLAQVGSPEAATPTGQAEPASFPSPEPPAESAGKTPTTEATPTAENDKTITATQEADERAATLADEEEARNGTPEQTDDPGNDSKETEDLAGQIEDETPVALSPEIPISESQTGHIDLLDETAEAEYSGNRQDPSDEIAPQDLPLTGLTSAQESTSWWLAWIALGIVSILLIMGLAAASGKKIP